MYAPIGPKYPAKAASLQSFNAGINPDYIISAFGAFGMPLTKASTNGSRRKVKTLRPSTTNLHPSRTLSVECQ